MATRKKALSIVLPKTIVTAARSAVNPTDGSQPGSHIQDRTQLYDFYNKQVADIRAFPNTTALLRYIARTEGPLSTAIHNLVQTANNGYSISAYTTDGNMFSLEGTNIANMMVSQLNTLYNYSGGYSNKMSFDLLLETMLREAIMTNGIGVELVLNKAFLPEYAQVVPLETIKWYKDDKGLPIPKQFRYGDPSILEPVDLDIATFWVQRMVGDPVDLYPRSMMEAAIKLLIYFEEFLEDVRRVVRQSGHARQTVSLNVEKAVATAPREVKSDPTKLKAWLTGIQTAVKTQLESIDPDEAIIMFDTATYKIESPNFGTKIDYTPMLDMLAGMWATSMKTPPSVLGMRIAAGSSSIGNVETLIFLKSAKALQTPVKAVMSRMLTLACRLFGSDVYVNFDFDPIDLRPELELESFYTMRQTRLLEQLSYGFISDDEAAVLMKTGPRPIGAPKLSGTQFSVNKGQNNQLPNTPGDTPIGKTLQPDKSIPRKAGGASQ